MDVAIPIHAVVPSLDGPVLVVLSRTTRPLTGREVHRLASVGSENGVRLALGRLTRQGVVTAEERAGSVFYLANREHVAWPAVELLADLRGELLRRLRDEIQSWQQQPLHASLFGSVARGTGDAESDIDVLVVRPEAVDDEDAVWSRQIDRLRDHVERWTGNRCQLFEVDVGRLAEHVRAGDPLVDAWQRDEILLGGQQLPVVLRQLGTRGDER